MCGHTHVRICRAPLVHDEEAAIVFIGPLLNVGQVLGL